jgi:hypothetical protein
MKRKRAKGKTRTNPPTLSAKPLREPLTFPARGQTYIMDRENGGFRRATPSDYAGKGQFRTLPPHVVIHPQGDTTLSTPVTMIYGVPLPPDLEEAVEHYAGDCFRFTYSELAHDVSASPEQWSFLRGAIEAGVRDGFYLAVKHYSEELKRSAAARPILEGLKKGRSKGGDATKRKAEPRRMAVRRQFRALRKSGFNKGDAREEIQQDYRSKGEEISIRQLERYTEGLS